MNKQDFLKGLDEIIEDSMFIWNSVNDLNNEISQNTWSISMGQSARLRFNLISDFHTQLPFGDKYKVLKNIEPILNEFLQFPYHEGFSILEIEEEVSEDEVEIEPFNVYSVIITNN
jgi:hypothetical protein